MRKYLLFICLIFVSCSQVYLEETQDAVTINARVSYDTLDTGIYLEWDTQWDFARIEISRGTKANKLSVFKDNLAQNEWLDVDNVPGKDYYYRVNAYNSKDRIIGQSEVYKGHRSYRPYDQIIVPSDLKTYFAKYADKIEIYWVGNVQDTFRIYRSDSTGGILTKIAEVSFNSTEELKFSDYKMEQGKSYFYKVSSVGKEENGTISEKISADFIEGSSKIAPKSVKTTTIVGGIALSWESDEASEYYQVYRSETVEGEYKLIVPFVLDTQYTDKNLPNIKGANIDGAYTYPSYYYKVKSLAGDQESEFSDPVDGHAIDPADFLSAPKNFNLTLNKSSYPYKLTLSWDAVGRGATTYRVSKIDNKGETNAIANNTSTLVLHMPNEEFSAQSEYIVQAINDNAGGLAGDVASKAYTSSTPAPPKILTITTNARTFETNNLHTNEGYVGVESRVYWKQDSWTIFDKPKYGNDLVGAVKKEWHVTSKVGNIDLTWDKQVESEFVAYYTIYRRKQGETAFKKIISVDPTTNVDPSTDKDTSIDEDTSTDIKKLIYSDTLFTLAEYKGSGTGDKFKYPLYEYRITATFGIDESAPSSILVGSAINPADILPAPDYVSVPAHWANGTGFTTYPAVIWQTGDLSPKGAEKIAGKTGANHMYLVWGDVPGISTYRVRHSRGLAQENWVDNWNYPVGGNNKWSVQWFNNNDTGVSMTGMYAYEDSIAWMYSKESTSFDVGSINGNAGNLLGDVRGIWFTEPGVKPAWYQ